MNAPDAITAPTGEDAEGTEFFMFWQPEPDSTWKVAPAVERDKVISQFKPKLLTVLSVNYNFAEDISAEEKWKLKYQGPVYFDFDTEEGETIDDVLPNVVKFLVNLRDKGVDLDSLRLFATGGKGFHVEMPIETVLERAPRTGITVLPYVVKEFAFSVYVNNLDLRVYTAGRGRMWRSPNVLRPNGKYKVPVTAAEIFSMTAATYADLCSAPREPIPTEPPTFNPTLAVLFSMAMDKVDGSMKKRKQGKTDKALVSKVLRGQMPASIRGLMSGQTPSTAGFQRIAMQLAVTARDLGMSEDALIAGSQGLIHNHQGDGSRYNSASRRDAELRRMYHYMADNPCYEFSVGGLISILPEGRQYPDLAGIAATFNALPVCVTQGEGKTAADWAGAIAAAGNNREAVTDLVTQFKATPGLGHVAREQIIKAAAKQLGVSRAVLDKDTQPFPLQVAGSVRPVIRLTSSNIVEVIDRGGELLQSSDGLYQRGGQLVEVLKVPERDDVRIAPVSPPGLLYRLASVTDWQQGEVLTIPPDRVVNAIHARGFWPYVRPLAGVSRQPILTPDGDMVGPGYHEGLQRYVHADPADFPLFEGTDQEAMARLLWLFREVAFESDIDRAGAIAAVLTAVLRAIFSTAPAILVAAHDKGSGKSILAQIFLAFGGGGDMCRFPRDEEEVAKGLLAALMQGAGAICYDNLTRHFDSESLAIVTSQPSYAGRILGSTQNVGVSTSALVVATGNNIKAVGDMARRTLTINLDAKCENPAGRKFEGDPVAEINSRRGYWVMTALRAVQGWFEAGCPKTSLPPIGTYTDWSMVRHVCVHYRLPDPGRCITRNALEDEDRSVLARFLHNWRDRYPQEPLTLSEAMKTASPELMASFREVAEDWDKVSVRALGKWASSQAGRVVDGLRLVSVGNGRNGKVWTVVEV